MLGNGVGEGPVTWVGWQAVTHTGTGKRTAAAVPLPLPAHLQLCASLKKLLVVASIPLFPSPSPSPVGLVFLWLV